MSSNVLPGVFAVVALIVSVVVALTGEVLMIAGSPNSTPAQLRTIQLIMWAIALGTLACVVVSIVLMTKSYPWAAVFVGGTPAVALICLFIVTLIVESMRP
jgi:peptidoglycan/LPS O-acetylase OafA/YrhL